MTPLDGFERLARRLIEGSLGNALGGKLEPFDVAAQIAHALEDLYQRSPAMGCLNVRLNPSDLAGLQKEHPKLAEDLADYIGQLVVEGEMDWQRRLEVRLLSDPNLSRRQIVAEACPQPADDPNTQIMIAGGSSRWKALLEAVDAYLIVDGREHVSLNQPVISLGRHPDNDVVIAKSTVSRHHAQMRWRYGRFILYDLGSRGGTFVNNQRIRESVLQAGDVVSFSKVPLIYGEGVDGTKEMIGRYKSDVDDRTIPWRSE